MGRMPRILNIWGLIFLGFVGNFFADEELDRVLDDLRESGQLAEDQYVIIVDPAMAPEAIPKEPEKPKQNDQEAEELKKAVQQLMEQNQKLLSLLNQKRAPVSKKPKPASDILNLVKDAMKEETSQTAPVRQTTPPARLIPPKAGYSTMRIPGTENLEPVLTVRTKVYEIDNDHPSNSPIKKTPAEFLEVSEKIFQENEPLPKADHKRSYHTWQKPGKAASPAMTTALPLIQIEPVKNRKPKVQIWNVQGGIRNPRIVSGPDNGKNEGYLQISTAMKNGNKVFVEGRTLDFSRQGDGHMDTVAIGYKAYWKKMAQHKKIRPYAALTYEQISAHLNHVQGTVVGQTRHTHYTRGRIGSEIKLDEYFNLDVYLEPGGRKLAFEDINNQPVTLTTQGNIYGFGLNYDF